MAVSDIDAVNLKGAGPKISLKEFARRRRELMAVMENNSIAILPSGAVMNRNSDIDFNFRQDSDFHYLSGFNEPDSVLVLVPGREYGEAILFCRERDPEYERWHGNIIGPERALESCGLDDAFPTEDIDDILPGLIEGKSKLYYAMGAHKEFDDQIIYWVNSISTNQHTGTRPPGEFVQLDQILHELRLFKSVQEISLLRRAAQITAVGHRRLMACIEPGLYEYQLEAELSHVFLGHGARSHAYPAIIGAGSNACIMHYISNEDLIKRGDLILIDAGCEYRFYASDVTRTIPATGKFSLVQRQIYEIVLAAQVAAIAQVQPGNHWEQPHDAAVKVITAGLIELGLLSGEVDLLIESGAYKPFCMHRTGHWMGLDVHDVGEYRIEGEPRIFEQGMVTTIEPGIYIGPDEQNVPAKYRGIGIRIEDDILVTKTGHEILTHGIPKTIDEIEAYMAEHNTAVIEADRKVG